MTDYATVSIKVCAKLLGLPITLVMALVRSGHLEQTDAGWITKASIRAYQRLIYKGQANRAPENEVTP